jgi:hypothetical protein
VRPLLHWRVAVLITVATATAAATTTMATATVIIVLRCCRRRPFYRWIGALGRRIGLSIAWFQRPVTLQIVVVFGGIKIDIGRPVATLGVQ